MTSKVSWKEWVFWAGATSLAMAWLVAATPVAYGYVKGPPGSCNR